MLYAETADPAAGRSVEFLVSNAPHLAASRWRALARRLDVRVFYDVGANDPRDCAGAVGLFRPIFPAARFVLFEANERHLPALRASGMEHAVAVLSDADGRQVTFHASPLTDGAGDSYYLERTAFYAPGVARAETRTTVTLDALVAARGFPPPDVIKLDVQGAELDVLRGAPTALAAATIVALECKAQEYNAGAPGLPEVVAFMDGAGFRLYDVLELHYCRDRLTEADLLFCRKDFDAMPGFDA
jgi:FkbM family methyltransferase